LNPETVIALGELCSGLLRSPHFELLGKLFEQQIAADLLQTKPSEADERERIYARRQGYLAFLSHMSGFATDYDALKTEHIANHDDDGIDDPSVHDF
jgi:hypothetical protein